MIRVPLTVIVFLYVLGLIAVVFMLWLFDEHRRQQATRRTLQFRLRCAICGFEFEDHSNTPLPGCPRCGRPNERVVIDPL